MDWLAQTLFSDLARISATPVCAAVCAVDLVANPKKKGHGFLSVPFVKPAVDMNRRLVVSFSYGPDV
jgi:hypothetical protein